MQPASTAGGKDDRDIARPACCQIEIVRIPGIFCHLVHPSVETVQNLF
jgi:hypothetical protein